MYLTSSSESEGFTKEDLETPPIICTTQPGEMGINIDDTDQGHTGVTGINSTLSTGEMGINIDDTDQGHTGVTGINSTLSMQLNTTACVSGIKDDIQNDESMDTDSCASSHHLTSMDLQRRI